MSESNEQQALANQRAYRHVVDKSKTGQAAPAFEEMLDTANPSKAPAWTAGAVKAWERNLGGSVVHWRKMPDGTIQVEGHTHNGGRCPWGKSVRTEADLDTDKDATPVPVLPAPEAVHTAKVGMTLEEWMSAPGSAWIETKPVLTPAPATPQPDPDRLSRSELLAAVVALTISGDPPSPDGLYGDLDWAIANVLSVESAILRSDHLKKALKGRRP